MRFSSYEPLLKKAAALAVGALMVAAMPPWCIWPALFAGMSVFYILLSTAQKKRTAFFYGWLFGFGYFTVGLSWIGNALLVGGSPYKMFWPLAVAALPAALAFFPAFAAMLIARFSKPSEVTGYVFFCAVLMGSEWLRGHIFTGFPWNLYGYTWANTLPMAQAASIGGIYGLSLLTCLWATLPGFLLVSASRRRMKTFLAALAILSMAGCYLYGAHRLAQNPPAFHPETTIRIVQPNIAQEDKWDPAKTGENLNTLLTLSQAPLAATETTQTILVWPETAISDFLLRDPMARAAIRTTLAGYQTPVFLLTGSLRFEKESENSEKKYYNSIVAYDRNLNALSMYDKAHLVPFGEYIPFQKFIPLAPVVSFSGFQTGAGPQTIHPSGLPYAFSPVVCYEIIFPGKVTNRNERPDFIVNVTNDSWYGDSAGPRQHFVQAQFRAIEEGIPVIRAANTGISGVIDSSGRIVDKIPLDIRETGNTALPKRFEKQTGYARFGSILFIFFLCSAFLFLYMNQHVKKKTP